jgi:gliding motility-associated-like protein
VLEATSDALFLNSEGGFYLAVYEEDLAEIVFGTYYTGNHVDGGTSRFDKNGIVYQGVCSGGGFSTTADAWATDQNTGWDIGVFKINFDASGVNAAVAANDISGCAPFEITFQNFSVGDQFLWEFGDGTTSTEYAPTYIYNEPGVYTVSLIASDSLSCNLADTVYFDISISTPQDFTPSFEYEVDCANQTIISNNTTGLDFLDYVWDMGDGTILEDYDITHEYAEAGDYAVTLTAVDNGCNADEEIVVEISIEPSVDAQASTASLEACDELEATFENASSNATSFSWDFGDGSNSDEAEPTYTFIGPASFEVILTASNPDACNISDTDTLTITVGANQVLESIFELIQIDCENFTVQSENQSIGENVIYMWDMGDGTILEGENISHDYSSEGTFNVTLTVTDELCDISADNTEPITITSEAVAVIGNGDVIGCNPLSLEFESLGAGITTWDFGDGSPLASGSSVSHVYTSAGSYTVTLSVVGEGTCIGEDETTSTVEVIEPPVIIPAFTATPIGDCEDLNVLLTNESEGDISSFTWELGDGNSSGAVDLEHIYAAPGSYEITLTAYNDVCDIGESLMLLVDLEGIPDLPEPPIARICPEIGSVEIDAGIEEAEYLWFNDETTQQVTVNDEGTYSVQVNLFGCWFPRDITVEQVEDMQLSKIVTLCETGSNFLIIEGNGISSYQWDNGDETAITYIDESGLYPFSVIDIYGCRHTGEIDATLLPKDPTVFIPNAFSPNGDGVNDYFLPVADDLAEYELVVHNRWGDEIFRTEDKNQLWNGGKQNGESYYVQDGVYTYRITYRSACSTERIVDTGTVTVLR